MCSEINNYSLPSDPKEMLSLTCIKGHQYSTIFSNDHCKICCITSQLLKHDKKIECQQNAYNHGQVSFEFRCSHGHYFMADENYSRGCKSCNLLTLFRKKHSCDLALTMDTSYVYVDDDSIMRFHCYKFIHNTLCTNPVCVELQNSGSVTCKWANDCRNFVSCNKDFLATPRVIKYDKYILNCAKGHGWTNRKEELAVNRIVELIFDSKFNDCAFGAVYTALNIDKRVAFIHLINKKLSSNLKNAATWCEEANVNLITIPKDIIKTSSIAVFILNELLNRNIISSSNIKKDIKDIRSIMRSMSRNNVLFKDRQ